MIGIFFLSLGYVLSQFYRSFLAVLAPVLSDELAMSALELSWASGIWFATFALAQFPVGVWLDTYGPKRTSSWLLFIGGGGGAALFAFATAPWMVILAMGLIGIGCSPVLMASFYIFARSFTAKRFAVLSSTFIGVGTLGNIFGSAPLAQSIDAFGWRNVGYMLALTTILISILIYFSIKDPEIDQQKAKTGSFLDLLKIRQLWLIFPLLLLGYSVAASIRGLWAGPFVADMFDLNLTQIGEVTLYMAIALTLGSFVYGPLDTLFKTRKWVVFTGNLCVFIALLWFIYTPFFTVFNVTLAFFIIGLFGANYAVLVTHGKGFVPAHLTGRGVTLLNFFSIGGAGLLQFLSGWVVDHYKVPNADYSGYYEMFILYALALGISLFIYLFSKDIKPSTPKA